MAEETCSMKSVLETSDYFSSLVELIPAKFYLQNEEKLESGFNNKKKISKADKKLLAKKAKLLRLDPSQHKSTQELQLEIEKKEKDLLQDDSSKETLKPIKVSEISSVPLDELREKLHKKLEQVRGKRKHTDDSNINDDIKKARLERKDKKNKKKESEKISANIKTATETEGKSTNNGSFKNVNGEIVFSKFDFASGNNVGSHKKKTKEDVRKLLLKAEKTKEKVERLEEEDIEKAKNIKDKMAWEKALKKAEGQKLKDDPKLLKKTIKRKEQIKSQSQKKWQQRVETVEKQKQEKRMKRAQNIKERKEGGKSKKSHGKGSKKKKSKPGF